MGKIAIKYFLIWVFRGSLLASVMIALVAPLAAAASLTGIRALDDPAIAVREPAGVFLVGVARAGGRLVAVGEHGVIIYSDDNGLSWTQAKVPVNADLNAVMFATASSGWAVGHYGVVLHSNDAGASWQVQLNGIEANQLTASAATHAVAVNDPSVGTAHAEVRAQHFLAEGPDKPFLTLWAFDPRHVIVFGAYRLAMETTDGGETWADWSLHIADPLSQNIYGAAAVGEKLFLTVETGLVFQSSDSGQSFVPAGQPATATLFGAVGAGDGDVLVFGVAGQAFIGPQDGSTWRPLTIGHGANLTCGLMMPQEGLVVAGEDGTLYISHDHAASFTRLATSLPMAISGMAQAADGSLIVVGSGGVIRVPVKLLSES